MKEQTFVSVVRKSGGSLYILVPKKKASLTAGQDVHVIIRSVGGSNVQANS